MLSSNMLLLIFILPIDVTFSTPTPGYNKYPLNRARSPKFQALVAQDSADSAKAYNAAVIPAASLVGGNDGLLVANSHLRSRSEPTPLRLTDATS
jgi:hypothetical protein